jgi:hypothetical protein
MAEKFMSGKVDGAQGPQHLTLDEALQALEHALPEWMA